MKRRSCSLVARPCHAGCFWKVRNDPSSPWAWRISSTQATPSADQLILQVCDAHIETERFHIGATEVGAEAGPLDTVAELTFLCGVTQARQSDIKPLRTK
jgi:hypothetical protein